MDGVGFVGVSFNKLVWVGWEDLVVLVNDFGVYLCDFEVLLDDYGLYGLFYGYFGEGCLYCCIDFFLD